MKPAAFLLILCISFLFSFYSTANADLDLISWWMLDEGQGNTAYDSAGGNDGTLVNGPVWTTGQINGALSFDGINDYVDCGYAFPSVAGSTTKTIMAWAKSDKTDYSGYASSGSVLHLYKSPENCCFSIMARGNPATWQFIYNYGFWLDSGVSVSTGQWAHLILVQNGADVSCYVNGVLENSVSGVAAPVISNPDNAEIGSYRSGYNNFFDGTIDDVRIYDRALSAEEIEQIFQYGEIYIAFNPDPINGATVVDTNAILSWWPGKYAASHNVYFGTDYNDVNDANTSSSVYMGNFDTNSWDPCGLDLFTTYYWRIDEVNSPNLWKGNVWSFNTKPVIELSKTKFYFRADEDGNNPNDQILEIRNSGAGTLNWIITYDCNWLDVYPAAGTSTGEVNNVNISVDITGLSKERYECELSVVDPCADNSPQTFTVILGVGCFPLDHPDYGQWYAVGMPDCWCYPHQCKGDADGLPDGKNNYWVSSPDLTILKSAWLKTPAQLTGNDACADFDHLPEGKNYYRVSSPDLTILKSYWQIPNGPSATCLPGNRNP
jgi:hypothetical protein